MLNFFNFLDPRRTAGNQKSSLEQYLQVIKIKEKKTPAIHDIVKLHPLHSSTFSLFTNLLKLIYLLISPNLELEPINVFEIINLEYKKGKKAKLKKKNYTKNSSLLRISVDYSFLNEQCTNTSDLLYLIRGIL